MKSDLMKARILCYWRYNNQCPYVALEASTALGKYNNGGQSDVLAINKEDRKSVV
jgi:hypothetical protein